VLDDQSQDDTADIVRAIAATDARLRLESAPALPAGWCGKQHACAQLARFAGHENMAFLDADVQLSPDCLARALAEMDRRDIDLYSGFPRQRVGAFLERLLIPLIQFVLLGFLSLRQMRQSRKPAFGAGCGQLFLTTRSAYEEAGGHAAIRRSLHDGLMLPRAYRAAGLVTDLFDATHLASCRMYSSASEVWRGLSKDATVAAVALIFAPRLDAIVRFRQPLVAAVLPPVGVLVFLAIQWSALVGSLLGRRVSWKGRPYPAV